MYRPAGPVRGAAILSHGFTRSRTTLGGHADAIAATGILAITPDMPYTFDFNGNARGLAELVALLRAGEFGTPVSRVVLVGFSAGGLSSLLAAATPGVVGYVGLDPFDRAAPDGKGALGLDFAPNLKTESVLLRAPPSRCNAQSVAAPWGQALPALRLRPCDRGCIALRLRIAQRLDVPARVRRNRSRKAGRRARNLDRGDGSVAAARGALGR